MVVFLNMTLPALLGEIRSGAFDWMLPEVTPQSLPWNKGTGCGWKGSLLRTPCSPVHGGTLSVLMVCLTPHVLPHCPHHHLQLFCVSVICLPHENISSITKEMIVLSCHCTYLACVYVSVLSRVWLFMTPWTVALLCLWDFPGKNARVGCHFLLQGIFPTQGSNPCLLHCRQILYSLSHLGSSSLLIPNWQEGKVVRPKD